MADVQPYDSTEETMKHIRRVRELVSQVTDNLHERAHMHDLSKLGPVEKPIFDEMTPLLEGVEFGSKEYTEMTRKMKPTLQHHYEHNSHHPQHWPNGIRDMSLLDICEMLCDWRASTERGKNGDIYKSIQINKVRYKIPEELAEIFTNTAKELGW